MPQKKHTPCGAVRAKVLSFVRVHFAPLTDRWLECVSTVHSLGKHHGSCSEECLLCGPVPTIIRAKSHCQGHHQPAATGMPSAAMVPLDVT